MGGGVSGKDLVRLLSETASTVTFSQREPKYANGEQYTRYENCRSTNEIESFDVKRGFIFKSGYSQAVDAVIFATGTFIDMIDFDIFRSKFE